MLQSKKLPAQLKSHTVSALKPAHPLRAPRLCAVEAHKRQPSPTDALNASAWLSPLLLSLSPLAAKADEVQQEAPPDLNLPDVTDLSSLSPGQLLGLFSPVIIYGLFSVYRATVNPKASIQDLLLFVALGLILFNIYSIAVLKVRYF